MNPNAAVFVPRSQNPPPQQSNQQTQNQNQQKNNPKDNKSKQQNKPQEKQQQTKTQEKLKVEEKPKQEKLKVEEKPKQEKPKVEEKVEQERNNQEESPIPEEKDNFQPSEEQLRKELEAIAKEEGKTVEELEKEESEMETKAVIKPATPDLEEDTREHLNIVFIGHVDAGKSTLSGQILFLSGMVDERTIQKYEREAKEKNRESWFLAYIMDTSEEERSKGITVEVGRAYFETKNKRYTILDAPGHKLYVPNMIGGASQADVGVLVISARKGEFETGFNRGGQTREHAILAKTLGVKNLIIAINKMDEPTVNWSKDRYDEIESQMAPFLKSIGYNPKKEVTFIPISAQKGYNVKDPIPKEVCPWYEGKPLLTVLDELSSIERLKDAPLRIPIVDKYRDGGKTWVLGKIESGTLTVGSQVALYPNKSIHEVTDISTDSRTLKKATAGENIRFALKPLDEDKVSTGFVICSPKAPVACQSKFEAQIQIIELLPHKSLFTAGYGAVLHIHNAVEQCVITVLLAEMDKKTNAVIKKKPTFVKNNSVVRCIVECVQPICLELFSDNPQLGRFTLRDEGKTIAVGKVISLGPKKKENNKIN